MLRLLLYLLLAFIFLRIVQTTIRIMGNSRRGSGEQDPFASARPKNSPKKDYRNIQDADFEDITDKKKTDPKQSPQSP